MRLPESTDDRIARELQAIERALAGEPVEPELAELAELALTLRDERSLPSATFTEKLDARAAEGFPRQQRRAPAAFLARLPLAGRIPSLPRGKLLPALAATASLVIVSVVVVASEDGDRLAPAGEPPLATGDRERPPAPALEAPASPPEGGPSRDRGPAAEALEDRAAAPSTTAPSPLPPISEPPGGVAPGARQRRVERSASLTLAAPADEVEEVADGVVRVTDRFRGFVLSSSVSSQDEGEAGASFDLRIPATRLRAALRELSELAHVRARTQSGNDITRGFVTAQDRLSDARGERRALLRRLAAADTPNETASIRARLRLVRSEIARARGELDALRERTNYAAVSVGIETAEKGEGGSIWTPSDALDDALRVLAVSLGVALLALAVAVPLALLALLGWVGLRAGARHRRERALDAA